MRSAKNGITTVRVARTFKEQRPPLGPSGQKPLWTCPHCGHRFVTRNLAHSCGRYSLEDHFAGKDPKVRQLFDRLVELAKDCGPVTVYAQKTRIVLQVRVRFAGALPRRRWLDLGLWLRRDARHPCLRRVEFIVAGCWLHHFRFHEVAELDRNFERLLRESYAIGCQQH